MTNTATLERNRTDAAPAQRAPARAKDDAAMLKAAANLTRDLNVPNSTHLLGRHARLGAARLCRAVRGDGR